MLLIMVMIYRHYHPRNWALAWTQNYSLLVTADDTTSVNWSFSVLFLDRKKARETLLSKNPKSQPLQGHSLPSANYNVISRTLTSPFSFCLKISWAYLCRSLSRFTTLFSWSTLPCCHYHIILSQIAKKLALVLNRLLPLSIAILGLVS